MKKDNETDQPTVTFQESSEETNPMRPPPIAFGTLEFSGAPDMEGLTTKSQKHFLNIDPDNDGEDEGVKGYKRGGYHPVYIGELINDRYVVVQKLGWGHFSTVWLAKDFKLDTYVALKVQKSESCYMESACEEAEILQKVCKQAASKEWADYLCQNLKPVRFLRGGDTCNVVQLLNAFVYEGPYGEHFCLVFEVLGINLREVQRRYNDKGIPLHLARQITKQILVGLDFLHRFCGIIHTDLKPENVMLCLTPEETKSIIENGQLESSAGVKKRIKQYQQAHGFSIDELPLLVDPPQKPKINHKLQPAGKPALTKKQKKNQLRKAAQKRKKLKEREGVAVSRVEGGGEASGDEEEEEGEEDTVSDEMKNRFDNWNGTGERLRDDVRVKIVDLGNACWTHHHFATLIQTRSYRSPETIIGVDYNTTADIWSLACMVFEMVTGRFLFEPSEDGSRGADDLHLAQIQEVCGRFSKRFIQAGCHSQKFFDKTKRHLRKVPKLFFQSIKKDLVENAYFKEEEAKLLYEFLLPMLQTNPLKRVSAKDCLQNPWMKVTAPNYLFKCTPEEYSDHCASKSLEEDSASDEPQNEQDSEDFDADVSAKNASLDEVGDGENSEISGKIDRKFIDRSFTNLGYIGYGSGIQLDDLDQDPSWQFTSQPQPSSLSPLVKAAVAAANLY